MSIDQPITALDRALGAEERANERVCELEDILADNERCISELRSRNIEIEFHLSKLRDLIWLGYCNTSGVIPMEFKPELKSKVKKSTKSTSHELA